MANGDRQQASLETLKLINAASTALRLYPEDSAKVDKSVEGAYQGVKRFLREKEILRFSRIEDGYMLGGQKVNKVTRERLQLLAIDEQLKKLGISEFVLTRGIDRKTFKKVLHVFNATPEQVHKAGGGFAFVCRSQLQNIFPEEYIRPGESKDEKEKKARAGKILKNLAGSQITSDHINYLLGRNKDETVAAEIFKKFQSTDVVSRLVAAASFSLLQILQKHKHIVSSPVFRKMLENVESLVHNHGGNEQEKYGRKSASLLVPVLDDASLIVFLCQDFSNVFGGIYYGAVTATVKNEQMSRVFQWMKKRYEKRESPENQNRKHLENVYLAYERFLKTPRSKQIVASGSARELLAKTEEDRKARRVQAGLRSLAEGRMEGLKNKEVCQSLPATIARLLEKDKESLAAAIIQNVVKGLKDRESELRPCFGSVLGGVSEKLAQLGRWDWLEKLTPVSLAWLKDLVSVGPCESKHVKAMQAMMNHAWDVEKNELAERILQMFYLIRSRSIEKPEELRRIIAHIQDQNVDPALLQVYLDNCLQKPVDDIICRKIIMQGPIAYSFLLDALLSSEKRPERIRLIKLLGEAGPGLAPILIDRLPYPMPWFAKRNIIRLLGESGTEDDGQAILEYITHEDLRVQQEALRTLVRIGRGKLESYLLQVLPVADLRMKIQIVKALFVVSGVAVVSPLAELLDDCKLYRGENRNRLAEEICRTLGSSGCAEAFPVLQSVIDAPVKQFGKNAQDIAVDSIAFIQEHGHAANLPQNRILPDDAKTTDGDGGKKTTQMRYEPVTDFPEEIEAYELLASDKLESAKKKLLDCIERSARHKQFKAAENLRLRLIDVDPTALAEIIRAAEVIEGVKTDGVDRDHIIIWSELYDLLTTEEFNAFYHVLQHDKYQAETVVVKQGDSQRSLFFINRGRVKLFYLDNDNEILVKTLGGGKIFGGEPFFNDSVWTLNVTSMTDCEISRLSMEDMETWEEEFPGLEPKIRDYCFGSEEESEFFKISGASRREDKRTEFSGTVFMDILGEGMTCDTTIRGEGSDISRGGVSFFSKIGQKKHAKMLLGRSVQIRFEDGGDFIRNFSCKGSVVAVRNLYSADLGRSVHVSFVDKVSRSDFSKLLAELKSS